jgi:hypothetical protein
LKSISRTRRTCTLFIRRRRAVNQTRFFSLISACERCRAQSKKKRRACSPFLFLSRVIPRVCFFNANASAALWRESKKSRPLLCENELISIHFFLPRDDPAAYSVFVLIHERVAAVTLISFDWCNFGFCTAERVCPSIVRKMVRKCTQKAFN